MNYTRTVSVWDDAAKAMKPVTVTITIDLDQLALELARRTNRSSAGKSCMHGKTIVATQENVT